MKRDFGTAIEIFIPNLKIKIAMKKILLLFTMVLLASCSGVKKTQKAINSGNYRVAIGKALKELQKNKTKKGHQSYVVLLEDAFQKHTEREQERIAKGLDVIKRKLEGTDRYHERIEKNLTAALDLAQACGTAYRAAPHHIKKLFNQSFFVRILVHHDGTVRPELKPPFDSLLGPVVGTVRHGSGSTRKPAPKSGPETLL